MKSKKKLNNLAKKSNIIKTSAIQPIKQELLWYQIILRWSHKQKLVQDNNDSMVLPLPLNNWQIAISAREAFAILKLYDVPIKKLNKYYCNNQVKSFLKWHNIYLNFCSKFNYISDVNDFNFININQHNKLQKYINNNNYYKVASQDPTKEIVDAAQFASLHYNSIKNPDKTNTTSQANKIGIVFLNLLDNYNKIDYIFNNYFTSNQYKIYISPKLQKSYIINIALLILEIANKYITKEYIKYEDFSKLLRTKYIAGGIKELSARTYIDSLLREKVDYKFNWKYLINYLSKKIAPKDLNSISIFINLCNNFTKIIDKVIKKNDNRHKQHIQTCNYWAQFIKKILLAFGWGIENINKEEQYLISCWKNLLREYSTSQNILVAHSFTNCIKILTNFINNYRVLNLNNFYKHRKNQSIAIIDLATALSSKFDYLWICGFTEINWPIKYKSNPFLPTNLQKDLKIPYGFEENKCGSEQMIQQLIANTNKQLICSYPRSIDGNLVNPSNLILHFPEYIISTNIHYREINSNCSDYKTHLDNLEPEVYLDNYTGLYRSNKIPGTLVAKLQLACPFQANAKIRLQANQLKMPKPYLDKATKGNVIHKVLANFWLKLNNMNKNDTNYNINTISIDSIKKLLFKITYKMIIILQRSKPIALNKLMLYLETNNIVDLCFNFIKKYDLNRTDFKIFAIEKKAIVSLKKYFIKIKIDRIDQLANGSLLVIDYKTGKSIDLSQLDLVNPELIRDFQLIIYSLYSDKIKGLALAIIRPEQFKIIGSFDSSIALENPNSLPNLKLRAINNWEENINNCYNSLYQLINEFTAGLAQPRPKFGEATCRNCDLKSICRIYIN